MSKYNEQYYIAFRPSGDENIVVRPNKVTAKRRFRLERLAIDGDPLFFENSYRDEDEGKWPVTELLMETGGFLVSDRVYRLIKDFKIDYQQFYPAVYVDDSDNWHEDYWYVGFYENLFCVDRGESIFADVDYSELKDIDEDDIDLNVRKYSLDEKVLDLIDEEKRLMFRMDGCTDKYVFVHEKIVDIFTNAGAQGIQFIKVEEFERGMQH